MVIMESVGHADDHTSTFMPTGNVFFDTIAGQVAFRSGTGFNPTNRPQSLGSDQHELLLQGAVTPNQVILEHTAQPSTADPNITSQRPKSSISHSTAYQQAVSAARQAKREVRKARRKAAKSNPSCPTLTSPYSNDETIIGSRIGLILTHIHQFAPEEWKATYPEFLQQILPLEGENEVDKCAELLGSLCGALDALMQQRLKEEKDATLASEMEELRLSSGKEHDTEGNGVRKTGMELQQMARMNLALKQDLEEIEELCGPALRWFHHAGGGVGIESNNNSAVARS